MKNNPQLYQQLFGFSPTKADQTRLKIIQAVITTIHNNGLSDTSFTSIAKVLGMKAPHLVYYFSSKEELLQMAIRYVAISAQATTVNLIKEVRDPNDQLKAFIQGAFDHMKLYPEHKSVLSVFYLNCIREQKYRDFNREIREMGISRVSAILKEINPRLPNTDCTTLSQIIQALITGFLIDSFTTNTSEQLDTALARTNFAVDTLIANWKPKKKK